MGLSSKKQTTNQVTDQTRTGTTTPNVPDWIQQPSQKYVGAVSDLLGQGADPFKPVTTPDQQAVWDAAGKLTGPDFGKSDAAWNDIGSVGASDIEGQSLLTGLENYYNPFKDQVLNPVLSDYDVESGKTRAAQAAAAAQNKAFQGSRYGIQEGETEGQLARGRAATEGGLLKDMYTEATGLSSQDAARRQAAMEANQRTQLAASQANQAAQIAKAQALAAEATNADASTRANLALQAQVAQQHADALTAQNQYPLEYLKQVGGLLGFNPATYTGQTMTDVMHGTTNTSTKNDQSLGSWFGDALTAAAASAGKAAMMAG